jgi:hypothetical protein
VQEEVCAQQLSLLKSDCESFFLSRIVTGHETWTQSLRTASQKTINGKASISFSPEEDEGYLFLRESHGQSFLNAEDFALIDMMPRGEIIDSNFL